MTFLADESCDYAVVRALRHAGHDVLAIAEISPSVDDVSVLSMGQRQRRILLTEDKGFGRWVYAARKTFEAVISLRFPATARTAMAQAVVDFINSHGHNLSGCFVVIQPGRIRISRPSRKR